MHDQSDLGLDTTCGLGLLFVKAWNALFQACLPMGYVYLNTKKNNSIYKLSLL